MKRIASNDMSAFLKHRFPLAEDRIAKLVLPVDLKQAEVDRLIDFLEALVMPPEVSKPQWPFAGDIDEDEDEDEEFEDIEDDDSEDDPFDHDIALIADKDLASTPPAK